MEYWNGLLPTGLTFCALKIICMAYKRRQPVSISCEGSSIDSLVPKPLGRGGSCEYKATAYSRVV